jgi:hypothetical protein
MEKYLFEVGQQLADVFYNQENIKPLNQNKMKEIHLIPTDRPSRLHFDGKLFLSPNYQDSKTINSTVEGRNIYITSDEEIKEGDWGLSKLNEVILFGRSYNEKFYNKIILTTDQDLIADGVQAIDDTFLEWFVKNPSCEEFEVEKKSYIEIKEISYEGDFQNIEYVNYKIIIPQGDVNFFQITVNAFEKSMNLNLEYIEEPKYSEDEFETQSRIINKVWDEEAKQETLEEAAENYSQGWGENDDVKSFIAGAKWQAKSMRWVSVKDELPNVNQYVIIYDGISVKDFYYFNNLKEFRSFYEGNGIEPKNENVTHWMPLPQPPIA